MPSLACHAGAGSNSLVQTAPVIYCCLFTFPSSTHAHTHAPTHTHSMQGAAGPAWGEAVLGPCRAGGRWDTRLSPAKEACLVRRRCAPCCTYILGALPSWRPWTLRGAHPICGCLCRAGAGCCPAEPQQCAFVGGMGPGCGSSPWALQGASGLLGCAYLVGPGVWPQPPHVHYSKASALSASLLGCPVGWQLQCSVGAQQLSEAMGGVFAPSPELPSRPSCCLWTPYTRGGGDVTGSFLHPSAAAPATAF